MDCIMLFREYTRELEYHLAVLNQSDCCQCGINESQCFLVVDPMEDRWLCTTTHSYCVFRIGGICFLIKGG